MQMILGQAHPRTRAPRGGGRFVPFVGQKSENAGVRIHPANPLDGTKSCIGWQVEIHQCDVRLEVGKLSHSLIGSRGSGDWFHVGLLADEIQKPFQQKRMVTHRQDANFPLLHSIRSSQYAALLNMPEPGHAYPPDFRGGR